MKATKQLKRVYFHYEELEEFQRGMWRVLRGDDRKVAINAAADLMRDCSMFQKWMREALEQWPNSCLHNLSIEAANRLAWLGHAGCCLGADSPEECTRAAWYYLTDDGRDAANIAAAVVVREWEQGYNSPQGVLL
jgi:hypothetical protein